MKLKGVNPLEQHLEKIVLIAVAGVFLIVLALQFLWEPNRVKVGSQTLAPGKAFDAIESKARQIKARMDSTNPPQLEDARAQLAKADVNLTEQFRTRMVGGAEANPPAVRWGKDPKFEIAESPTGNVQGAPIAPLTVPAPGTVVVAPFRATIDPTETLSYPELKPLLPAEQPLDKAWVTAEARIDGSAIKAALAANPEGGKTRAIPRQWWNDTTAIFAVKLERQERAVTGDWSEPAEVKPPPGAYDVAAMLKNVAAVTDMDEAVSSVRASGDAVVRPAFYRTLAGQAWKPPSEVAPAVEAIEGAPPQVKELKSARDHRENLLKQREKIEKQPVKTPTPGGGGGTGGGGKGGGSSGGGGAAQPPRNPESDKQAQLKKIDDQIKKDDDKIHQLEDKLRELGLDDSGKKVKAAAPAAAGDQTKPLFETGDLQVWSHDLTVEPGKTYRYRVSVAINNPAFGRGNALVPEQQDLAKNPLAYSQPSDWSAPVTVPADHYYFITGTSEPDVAGPAHATVELYQFFYGYYRKGTSTLEPGDMVAAKLMLPAPEKLPIYDLAAVPVAPGSQPGVSQPPVTVAPPTAPAPGDRADPRGKGGAQQPSTTGKGGARGTPAQPVAPAAQAQAKLPENSKPWTKPLVASADAVLLDVARPAAGADGSKAEALLRVAEGAIESRDPDEIRTSDIYKKLSQSAKEGESQPAPAGDQGVNPAGKPVPPVPKAPTGPKTKDPKPPPPSGGGGGGTG